MDDAPQAGQDEEERLRPAIAAAGRDPRGRHYWLPPRGRCREVISNFEPEAWVIVTTLLNHWHVAAIARPGKVRIGHLLPLKPNTLRC